MFTRIVKLELRDDQVTPFLANFEKIKSKIRNFPGCTHLSLLRDKQDPSIFFTYSKWKREEDLEHYRTSSFFKVVWSTTKPMFRKKAEAWSVDVHTELH